MKTNLVAWYCQECGRKEAPPDQRDCLECGEKMQRCSRYEWFLADELLTALESSGRNFKLIEQYPVRDHRGFYWYWDLYIWVAGKSYYGGYGEVIDIQGEDHQRQRSYSGPGGGYTRDYDKSWEISSAKGRGYRINDIRYVTNEECSKRDAVVWLTARLIVEEVIVRADSWA